MSIPVIQGIEKRSVLAELRMAGDEMALVGYAALFNNESKDLGGFRETIKPTAFTRSLKNNADVKALFNHQPDNILGRTKSGTLSLSQDERGLKWRCALNPKSQFHRDLAASVERGDVDECSFAFTVAPGGQQWAEGPEENGQPMYARTLTDVDLLDVSAVVYPAYDNTSVQKTRAQLRSQADYIGNDAATKRLVEAAAQRTSVAYHSARAAEDAAAASRLGNDPHRMTIIRLLCNHPTLGSMGTYTAVERHEAEGLVSRGWAKFDRP